MPALVMRVGWEYDSEYVAAEKRGLMQDQHSSNVRPTYLLVEPETEGVSCRKLILETVLKHNILLANTLEEAQATIHVFPNVDAVIVHSAIRESSALVSWLREQHPQKYIIFLAEPTGRSCAEANVVISGYDPVEILVGLESDYEIPEVSDRRAVLLDDLVRTLKKGPIFQEKGQTLSVPKSA